MQALFCVAEMLNQIHKKESLWQACLMLVQ